MRARRACRSVGVLLLMSSAIFGAGESAAQVPALSSVPVPRPANLGDYVRDEQAARLLGKALFWDMQVGSDNVQACATCHFRAGADARSKNQVSPGLLQMIFRPDGTVATDSDLNFDGQGPNDTLGPEDFPLRKLADTRNRESAVVADSNNGVSSQGVHHAIFGQSGDPGSDPDGFYVGLAGVAATCAASSRATRPR